MTDICTDCPDHEACMTGWPCDVVKRADADARLERVLANIARPGPIDDSHVDRDREDWPGQDAADRMADDAADRYERNLERNHP